MKWLLIVLVIVALAVCTGTWIFDGLGWIFGCIGKGFEFLSETFNFFGWNSGIV